MYDNIISRAAVLALLALASTPGFASHPVTEQREANVQGTVQVNGLSGSFEVLGWDKPALEVTGTLGDKDHLEISGDPAHWAVQVRGGGASHGFGGGGDTQLTIHVPIGSAVNATLVSADLKTAGINGDVELHMISGDSKGQVGGNLRVSSVSGNVRLTAPSARNLDVKTVSGDIEVSGGAGESEISTISGTAHVTLGTQSHVHFKSTSGDLHLTMGLARDAMIDGEAVSGDVSIVFRDAPSADFDVETRTGDIDNCFGPKPTSPAHGPGQRLMFRSGESSAARVHIVTYTGDIELCAENAGHH